MLGLPDLFDVNINFKEITANTSGNSLLPDYPYETATVRPDQVVLSNAPTRNSLTVGQSADNAPFRIILGRDKVSGQFAWMGQSGGNWVVVNFWCLGEIDAIESLFLNGKPCPVEVTHTHYLGILSQGVDPTLAGLIGGYADNLVWSHRGGQLAMAYSVSMIPAHLIKSGIPRLEAIIRGMKFNDPRTSNNGFTENGALILAGVLSNNIWGGGWNIDQTSVSEAADFCDELVGGEKRRRMGLTLNRPQKIEQVAEQLRIYAGCFIVREASVVKFVIDKAGPIELNITPDLIDKHQVRVKGTGQTPTVVKVKWTDRTGDVWREVDSDQAIHPDVGTTLPYRETTIRMPGCFTHAQAYREAVERFNWYWLADIEGTFVARDEALKWLSGMICSLTTSDGLLTNKPIRLISIDPIELGRYRVKYEEYQDNIYSDLVVPEPIYADTQLPDPLNPPALTNLLAVEEPFESRNGVWDTRFKITFDAGAFPYQFQYEIQVVDGSDIIFSALTDSITIYSGALKDLVPYIVRVRILTAIGGTGVWANFPITAQGKFLIPGDVPSISGYEIGGTVYLQWIKAIDKDIWGYEIRWGAVGVSWNDAAVIDEVDTLRLSAPMPAGQFDFLVKAIDSVDQRSVNEARTTINITLDTAAIFVDEMEFVTASSNNTIFYKLGRVDSADYFVTNAGESWGSLFTNPMNTYNNPLYTYHVGVNSDWISDIYDAGVVISGSWSAQVSSVIALSGSYPAVLELSSDGFLWNIFNSLAARTSARYARVRLTGTGADTFHLKLPKVSIQVDAVPHSEASVANLTSNLLTPIRVELRHEYVKLKSVPVVSPIGNQGFIGIADNVNIGVGILNFFDAYVLDTNNNQVAVEFGWQVEGIR